MFELYFIFFLIIFASLLSFWNKSIPLKIILKRDPKRLVWVKYWQITFQIVMNGKVLLINVVTWILYFILTFIEQRTFIFLIFNNLVYNIIFVQWSDFITHRVRICGRYALTVCSDSLLLIRDVFRTVINLEPFHWKL
jgi:hypothetical protein